MASTFMLMGILVRQAQNVRDNEKVKALIMVGCLLVFTIVKLLFLRNVSLGAIASAVYWGAMLGVASLLSKRWDRHKAKKRGSSYVEE